MLVYKAFFSLLLITLIVSCEKDETLIMEKRPYTGNELRIDGVFCHIDSISGHGKSFFLYRDGIFLNGESFTLNSYEEVIDKMIGQDWISFWKQYKSAWGLFIVEGNLFRYERWTTSSGGFNPTYVYEGKIIDETTIQMERSKHSRSGGWMPFEGVYRLQPISHKPDSTNRFMN